MNVNYKIIATTRAQKFANRHGVTSTKGGQFVGQREFTFPHTEYYLAFEMCEDEFPNCELNIEVEKEAHDLEKSR